MTRQGLALAALLLAVVSVTLAAAGARAQEPPADPDEVTGLRVTRAGRDVALSWQAPVTTPDAYQVRRCLLTSLPVTWYGNCVAQGLTSPSHAEIAPAGDVFYLVSGTFAGAEGSLGRNFDGLLWRDRMAPACGSPGLPYAMAVDVVLDSAVAVSGAQVVLEYPAEAAAYVPSGGDCAGIFASGLGVTNSTIPGILNHACILDPGTPATGPGTIARFNFQVGECPITLGAFTLVSFRIVDDMGIAVPATCSLR